MIMKTGTKTYVQHIDCIHKQHLVNQGIAFCFEVMSLSVINVHIKNREMFR